VKELPHVDPGFGPLYELLMAPIRTELMMTGIGLGLFDHLVEPTPAETIAGTLGTHPGNTTHLLDHLAMIGLVLKRDGLYENARLANSFLVKSSATYLGRFLEWCRGQWFGVAADLRKLVLDGPPAGAPDIADDRVWVESARIWGESAAAGMVGLTVDLISNLPEWHGLTRMLDLGGGSGLHSVGLVASHPELTSVVFDQPPVAEVARGIVAEYGLSHRIEVSGGDYMVDPLGGPYDLVWASATLNFAKPRIDDLMAKVYRALNPDGIFACLQDGMTHDRTQPQTMLGHLGMVLFSEAELRFDQGFLAEAMLRAGFRSVRSKTVDTPFGPLDLDVGLK
jgi:SAM-dependent methyltransferase